MTEAAAAQIGEPGRRGADEDARGADAGPDGVAVSSPEASAARPMAAGRLAELAVHDLALIEKPAPARVCSSMPWGWLSGRAQTLRWCATGPSRPAWRHSSIGLLSR
jgi:hypothetical protein